MRMVHMLYWLCLCLHHISHDYHVHLSLLWHCTDTRPAMSSSHHFCHATGMYIVTVSVSLLLSYHAATCQSCCFIVTDTISSLLWCCTEADCYEAWWSTTWGAVGLRGLYHIRALLALLYSRWVHIVVHMLFFYCNPWVKTDWLTMGGHP